MNLLRSFSRSTKWWKISTIYAIDIRMMSYADNYILFHLKTNTEYVLISFHQ